ncbi:MAG TPA: CopG family transcriptional regulator [Dehalococcoidia bacterium]|nr:CopG family transcriptional regulator [Dehalococcoidia bacterium]
MKRLLVTLPEDLHEELRELAHRKKTTMAALLREAVESAYEDELDAIALDRALEESARDPSGSMSWEEFKESVRSGVQS